MSSRDEEVGARIAAARTERRMSQATLAAALGVGTTVMSKIENGKRRLDGFELALAAEALGTTSRALLGMATRTSALLAAARLGSGDNEPALNRARELLELDGVADQLGLDGRAAPRRPAPSAGTSPSALAAHVLAEHGGFDGVSDLTRVVEREFGVDVALEPLGDGPAGLLVQHVDEVALVLLNSDHHPSRRRFTLAHELGHWLLNDGEPLIVDRDLGGTSEVERRANRFAAELLMPRSSVRRLVERSDGLLSAMVDGLVTFGVSREAFGHRLTGLGLVSKDELQGLFADTVRSLFARAGRQSDYDAWASPGPPRRVPSRIEKRLVSAYCTGRIGIGMLAQAFNERPSELADQLTEVGIVVDVPALNDDVTAI